MVGNFFFSRSSPTVTSIFALCAFARSFAALASSAGPRSLAGVTIRSRPSVTPSMMASAIFLSAPFGQTSRALPAGLSA